MTAKSIATDCHDGCVRVDPMIFEKQKDWEDICNSDVILDDKALTHVDTTFNETLHLKQAKNFPTARKGMLAYSWFTAAVDGSNIFYPQNENEIYWYSVHKSMIYNTFVDMCILIIFLSPIIINNNCFATYGSVQQNTNTELNVFVLLATLVQLFDIYLFTITSHWNSKYQMRNIIKTDQQRAWHGWRLVAVVILILNSIANLASHNTIPNLSRALVPVLFFARRDNYRQLVEGIYFSFKKSLKLLRVLLYVLLLWAFVGFCVFRRYGGDTHFGTYFHSLYTCFHCVLSRPTVLYRLKAIFTENEFSALYFVMLTLFGDIVLTSLIVAIGTRNFRDFSISNFKGRLKYRHTALSAVWALYAMSGKEALKGDSGVSELAVKKDDISSSNDHQNNDNIKSDSDEVMSLESFILFGRHLGLYYKLDKARYAQYLFESEDKTKSGFISKRQFFRLAAAISTGLVITTKDIGSVVIEVERAHGGGDSDNRGSERDGSSSTHAASATTDDSRLLHDQVNLRLRTPTMGERPTERGSNSTIDIGGNKNFGDALRSMSRAYDNQEGGAQVPRVQYFAAELSTYLWRRYKQSLLAAYVDRARVQCFYAARYNVLIKKPLVVLRRLCGMKPQSATDGNASTGSASAFTSDCYAVKALHLVELLLYFLLIMEQCLLAEHTIHAGHIAFAWLVWLSFSGLNLVNHFASCNSKFSVRMHALINLFNFIALCCVSQSFDSGGSGGVDLGLVAFLTLAQSARFVRFFDVLPRINVFVSLLPIITRIVVFYGMILYFFAVIGHTSFCSLYSESCVSSVTDDDAASWLNFSNLFNFDTFLSSLYTVAQVAVLSNWSIIMDAGAHCSDRYSPFWVYLYFFSFRILIVVVILPLLMSCIIQTFIQNLTKSQASVGGGSGGSISAPASVSRNASTVGLSFYNISGKRPTSSMAALWSSSGRETVPAIKSKDADMVEELKAKIQEGQSQLYEVVHSNKLLVESLFGVASVTTDTDTKTANSNTAVQPTTAASVFHSYVTSSCQRLARTLQTSRTLHFHVSEAHIIREQTEWLSLLSAHDQANGTVTKYINRDKQMSAEVAEVRAHMPQKLRGTVGAVWFNDAVNGRTIDYPVDAARLLALRISRSSVVSLLMYAIVLAQVLSVFIIVPRCFNSGGGGSESSGNDTFQALAIFDLFCVCFYIFDVGVDFFVRGRRTTKEKLSSYFTSWTWLRLASSLVILLESCVQLAYRSHPLHNLRLVRILYPVLLLSRDQNYKEMIKGLFFSVTGTRIVYVFLLMILCVYTLVGYFLFHRYTTHAKSFMNLLHAFATVLHCFTSGTFALYVVEPYAAISQASQLFFVLLTYSTEVLCIALIIAAGQVHYRVFGGRNFSSRMRKRFDSFTAIWRLFEEVDGENADEEGANGLGLGQIHVQEGFMSLDKWLIFAAAIEGKYAIDPLNARDLFMYVKSTTANNPTAIEDETPARRRDSSTSRISKPQFFRLLALLYVGARCRLCTSLLDFLDFTDRITKHESITAHDDADATEAAAAVTVEAKTSQSHVPYADTSGVADEGQGTELKSLSHTAASTAVTLSDEERKAVQARLDAIMTSTVESRAYHLSTTAHSMWDDLYIPVVGAAADAPGTEAGQQTRSTTASSESPVADDDEAVNPLQQLKHGSGTTTTTHREVVNATLGDNKSSVSATSVRADTTASRPRAASRVHHLNRVSELDHLDLYSVLDSDMQSTGFAATVSQLTSKGRRGGGGGPTAATLSVQQTSEEGQGKSASMAVSAEDSETVRSLFTAYRNHRTNVLYIKEKSSSALSPDILICCSAVSHRILALCQYMISVEVFRLVTVAEVTTVLAHILLIVQLSYYTSAQLTSSAWSVFGYFLQMYFLCEMFVRMVAMGEKRYFRNSVFVFQFLINIGSVVLLGILGTNYDTINTVYLLAVLFQSMRLVLMLWVERGDDSLRGLMATTARVVFLLSCAIYCFAIIAQDAFCGVLSDDTVIVSSTNDDDASAWNQFSDVLNFNNYLQTMFTLFEVTVLGSWSMVMDATVKSGDNPIGTYFFFYVFRLLMTLVMLPLLMGFVINSCISLNDSLASSKSRKLLEKKERRALQRRANRKSFYASGDSDGNSSSNNNAGSVSQPPVNRRSSFTATFAALLEEPEEDDEDDDEEDEDDDGSLSDDNRSDNHRAQQQSDDDGAGEEEGAMFSDVRLTTAVDGATADAPPTTAPDSNFVNSFRSAGRSRRRSSSGGKSEGRSKSAERRTWFGAVFRCVGYVLRKVVSAVREHSARYNVYNRMAQYLKQNEVFSQYQAGVDKHDTSVSFVNIWTTGKALQADARTYAERVALTSELENISALLAFHCRVTDMLLRGGDDGDAYREEGSEERTTIIV